MTNDFLFELGTEELPSGQVRPLANALVQGVEKRLLEASVGFGKIQTFATPRRLAFIIHDLALKQPTQTVSKRGPAVAVGLKKDEPTPALLGFAKSCGVEVSALRIQETDKGPWFFYEATLEGEDTQALLPKMIQASIDELPIPKPMRWGAGHVLFARPVHWVLMLLGHEIVSGEILGVKAGRTTRGHRFHAPNEISLQHTNEYEAALLKAYVMANFEKRQEKIIQDLHERAQQIHAKVVMPQALLDEVTSIVEWPVVMKADFDSAFLDVPSEALIASMQAHQKCFALKDANDHLMPSFFTVANINPIDPHFVIAGNEKVMRARLSDAAFFYQQDKKTPLEQRIEATKKVIFEARLGSLYEKSERVAHLVKGLVAPLNLNEEEAIRAVRLSKCDLLTGMVGEFPELQGLMGYYYALNDQEPKDVANALYEQYKPAFAKDEIPQHALGLSLSLADRIDTLVGIFAVGQKPSGVKDPYKLRRHALAVVRMLIEQNCQFGLMHLLKLSQEAYVGRVLVSDDVLKEVHQFILERLYAYYQAQDITSDKVDAVISIQSDVLSDLNQRLHALVKFWGLDEARALASACKRVNNLLNHAQMKQGLLNPALLDDEAEKALFKALQEKKQSVISHFNHKAYTEALLQTASLRPVVDAFFENVLVMADDEAIKQNRLGLLFELKSLLEGVAQISKLQVEA